MDIDVQGGEKIHDNEIDCKFVFVDAPDLSVIEERLNKRGTETPEVIEKRLNNAKREIERGKELEYYEHVVNDDLNTCFAALTRLIE